MIEARAIIDRLRRDLIVSAFLRRGLLIAAGVCLILQLFGIPRSSSGSLLFLGVVVVWMALSFRSTRGSRLAAVAPQLIAAGELAEAEQSIRDALGSFSLFQSIKLRSLHHLAVLRHAQGRWSDSALFCRELLQHREGPLAGMTRSARLILADSMLQLGDPASAYPAIASLYTERLSLAEAMELTAIQLEYLAHIGQWPLMLDSLKSKLDLADLLPPSRCVRAHALLAQAAEKSGKTELGNWLTARMDAMSDGGAAAPANTTPQPPETPA